MLCYDPCAEHALPMGSWAAGPWAMESDHYDTTPRARHREEVSAHADDHLNMSRLADGKLCTSMTASLSAAF